MPNWKVQLLYNMNEGGWSETHYVVGETISDAILKAKNIGDQRVFALNPNALWVGERISELDAKGLVTGRGRVFDVRSGAERVDAGGFRDQFTTSWFMRDFDATRRIIRKYWLHGLPDDWVGYNQAGLPSYPAAANNWLNAWQGVVNINTLIKSANQNELTNPKFVFANVSFTTDGYLKLEFNVDLSTDYKALARVVVRRYRGTLGTGVNGYARIAQRVDNRTIILDKRAPHCAEETDAGGAGYVMLEWYTFTAPAGVSRERPSSRKVGRPFFSPVGTLPRAKGCLVTRAARV